MRTSLKHLSQLVHTNKIVICKADKDGKIIIVDYKDYQKIMEAELEQFEILNDWNIDNKNAKFDVVMVQCYNKMIELHSLGEIKDDVLFHTCGIKNYNGFYKKVNGPTAKYFACYNSAYGYPLFKTHKLNNQLLEVDIMDIPRRFLQSAGDITTSRITAFLEIIFKPISTNYCQFQLNEYCRDSKHYLMELENWKSTQPTNLTSTLFINTADVKSLYPSVNRDLIPIALNRALKTQSSFKLEAQQILVELTMTCLNNVILQYLDKFYVQKNGIVIGDNHSVSIANIFMHYILLPLAKVLNKTVVFKRYIDDIIWLSYNYSTTTKIKELLQAQFSDFNLQLVFNSIYTENMDNKLEFLDVLHVTTLNATGGFITKNFIKSTAKDRCFLNGASHHPTSVYKSIVFGEAVRLRRLNERKSDYLKSLVNLKDKCFR